MGGDRDFLLGRALAVGKLIDPQAGEVLHHVLRALIVVTYVIAGVMPGGSEAMPAFTATKYR